MPIVRLRRRPPRRTSGGRVPAGGAGAGRRSAAPRRERRRSRGATVRGGRCGKCPRLPASSRRASPRPRAVGRGGGVVAMAGRDAGRRAGQDIRKPFHGVTGNALEGLVVGRRPAAAGGFFLAAEANGAAAVGIEDVHSPGDRSRLRARLAARGGEIAAQPVIGPRPAAPRRSGVRPPHLRAVANLWTTAAGGPSIDSNAIVAASLLGEIRDLTGADAGGDRQAQQQGADPADAPINADVRNPHGAAAPTHSASTSPRARRSSLPFGPAPQADPGPPSARTNGT